MADPLELSEEAIEQIARRVVISQVPSTALAAPANRPAPPRLGLTVAEAAQAVGMSESSFKRHVQPELRLVRRGSLRIIPLSEIEQWLEHNATFAGSSRGRVR